MERYGDCMYRSICKYEQECSMNCIRYVETNYLLEHSGIPINKRTVNVLQPSKCDVKAFEQLAAIRQDIDTFVEDERILYLCSNICGNGKTTWAIKLLLQYFNSIWEGNGFEIRGTLVNVPTFLMRYKEFNNPKSIEYVNTTTDWIRRSDLIVFDDIGTDYVSKYDYGIVFSLIDECIFQGKALIFTSNYLPDQLEDSLGQRLYSRICSDIVIELNGMDRRGE